MATLNNIGQKLQQKLQASLTTLPTVVGNEAVVWFKANFRRQGWPGDGLMPWKPRKANAKRNAGRGILINTGRLSRSPRLLRVSGLTAFTGSDVPYAGVHNDGFSGTVTVGSHKRAIFGTVRVSTGKSNQPFKTKRTIIGSGQVKSYQRRMNMPQRKFMGNSPVLVSILRRKATVHIGRDLKK